LEQSDAATYGARVADWDDVRRVATALPAVTEVAAHGHTGAMAWRVKDKTFLWERPLGKRDLAELGEPAPGGPVLAARVPDIGARDALVAAEPEVYFTIAHFDGFPAVLARLDRLAVSDLEELAVEAWLARAPKRAARAFLDGSTS
jgi:hypothetical protein